MYTIKLHDGNQIGGLSMNGSMYVSKTEITTDMLSEDALEIVTIEDAEGSKTILHNAICDAILHWDEGWLFNLREPTVDEILDRRVTTNIETIGIVFVVLAENGAIDEVTASEHMSVFSLWEPNIDYVPGNLRVYPAEGDQRLYKCTMAHRSQGDWTPDKAVSLWSTVSDPAVEFPDWSQPIGAHDAYQAGDKVSHNDKHWISTCDNNVWEPGVYGWDAYKK